MSDYYITVKHNASDEAYLTAQVENVHGGKLVKAIIQNSNISNEKNGEDIKKFLAYINNCTVDELPNIDDFLATNVHLLPSRKKIESNYVVELDF